MQNTRPITGGGVLQVSLQSDFEDFYLSDEWRDMRADIIERDGFRCRVCVKTEKLRVHHIIPRMYRHIAGIDIDHPSNLITLCEPHQLMADRLLTAWGERIE